MTRLSVWMVLLLPMMLVYATPAAAQANTADCNDGAALNPGFASGSNWRVCARISQEHGLELQQLSWQAPGDRDRSVLARLHPAAVLAQAPDAVAVTSLFANAATGSLPLPCSGERHVLDQGELCVTRQSSQLLKKFGDIRGVHGAHWRISATRTINNTRLSTSYRLSEDGRIGVRLAVRDAVPTAATDTAALLRVTWRIDPSMDDGAADLIEEYDFTLDRSLGSRRLMTVRPLLTETLRQVDHQAFRGWRLLDPSGAGYYLDSQRSVRGWPATRPNWARFDVAVTRRSAGEIHAADTLDTGASLDQWVNGDSLAGESPVLWYSQTLPNVPGRNDVREVSFELLPFDWNLQSPFPLDAEGGS